MRWVTYRSSPDGSDRVGLLRDGMVHGVPGVTRLLDLLGDNGERLFAAAHRSTENPAEVIPLDSVRLRPPIPVPPSIRDFMAFEAHVVTSHAAIGLTVDPGWYERPAFYFTNPASLHGAHDPVAVPPGSTRLDYELEVAAVVGRAGADLTPDEATQHIAGFVLFCDWSARDLQAEEMRLHLGPAKGKDFATSLGPWMVTPDEVTDPTTGQVHDLVMQASVNGEQWSGGNLADLYWSFAEMIAYASRGTRVMPGDLIGSGTVGTGCILELATIHGETARPYLRPGDRVHLGVEQMGAIDASIVAGHDPVPLRANAGRSTA